MCLCVRVCVFPCLYVCMLVCVCVCVCDTFKLSTEPKLCKCGGIYDPYFTLTQSNKDGAQITLYQQTSTSYLTQSTQYFRAQSGIWPLRWSRLRSPSECLHGKHRSTCVCVCLRAFVCMYVCMYAYLWVCVCAPARQCVCARTYVCVRVCLWHIQTQHRTQTMQMWSYI